MTEGGAIMKPAIIMVVAAALIFGTAYFGVPMLMKNYTSELRSEVQDLKQKVQKVEDEAAVATLQPDADARHIIKTVNAVSARINAFEESYGKDMFSAEESIKKQKSDTEDMLKKQKETIEKNREEMQSMTRAMQFDSALADIRSHILKARLETIAKNIGNARVELDFIDELLSASMDIGTDENRKAISELRTSVKKTKSEMDTDLPSAVNRLNNLWYETSRLLRKA
jgi:DNA repair exonuclease SbcCD ATPase subunit